MKLNDFYCDLCGSSEGKKVDFDLLFFKTSSHWKGLFEHENFICEKCGVVFAYPQMSDEELAEFYNTVYRDSSYALSIEGRAIDVPIKIPGSGISLQRFKTFYETIVSNSSDEKGLLPESGDVFIDYGAYQGMFLHGVHSVWKCRCIAYDYNEKGIDFAKKAFGFADSVVAQDIYKDTFLKKAKYVSLIHTFEHLKYPTRFLRHVNENILLKDGFLYIEVPNLYAYHLGEPSHFYTYSLDTLGYCLDSNGFEIIDMFTTGYPPPHTRDLTHSEKASLVCLCRPKNETARKHWKHLIPVPNVDSKRIYSEIKRNWNILSAVAVKRQFIMSIKQICRFFWFAFVVCTESISYKFAIRIRNYLKRHLSATVFDIRKK